MIAYAAAVGALVSCVPSTTVEQAWTTPAARSQPALQRVVTVFESDSITIRRAAEDELARDLRARGIAATPAYLVLASGDLDDLAAARSKLQALGFDGVVTMRLVYARRHIDVGPPVLDGYAETVMRVETSAYSLATNRVVWSVLTRTVDEDLPDLLDETSAVVAREITSRGVVIDEG